MTYEKIRVGATSPIARITMRWPEKRNALSIQMMSELTRALSKIGADSSFRAVILAAEGTAFSGGHFLSEMIGKDISHQRRVFEVCVDLMQTVQKFPQPVVAEIQGTATAAGCQLVATCDLAVAAEQASFATPGVKIGLLRLAFLNERLSGGRGVSRSLRFPIRKAGNLSLKSSLAQ